MTTKLYCDGGCKVGSGLGALSYLVVKDGDIQYLHSSPIKKDGLTNNQAEYLAVMMALTDAPLSENIELYSDSELVLKQIRGEYAIKDPTLIKMYQRVYEIVKLINQDIKFINVPRTNKYIMICDKMNKQMMEMI